MNERMNESCLSMKRGCPNFLNFLKGVGVRKEELRPEELLSARRSWRQKWRNRGKNEGTA